MELKIGIKLYGFSYKAYGWSARIPKRLEFVIIRETAKMWILSVDGQEYQKILKEDRIINAVLAILKKNKEINSISVIGEKFPRYVSTDSPEASVVIRQDSFDVVSESDLSGGTMIGVYDASQKLIGSLFLLNGPITILAITDGINIAHYAYSDDSFIELYTQIKVWHEKYRSIPTFDNLITIVKTKYDDEIEQDYLVDLVEVVKKQTVTSDKEFVIEETVQFCHQQAMKNAILESVDLLKKEKYEDIHALIRQAMIAGAKKEIGHSLFDDVLERTVEKRNPVTTGMKILDEHVAGGLSGGYRQ